MAYFSVVVGPNGTLVGPERLASFLAFGWLDAIRSLQIEAAASQRQSEALAASIDDQLADAMAKLDAIPEPLESAVTEDPGAIVAAQDALQALQVSIQVDLAQDLSVTITFNDNDGD